MSDRLHAFLWLGVASVLLVAATVAGLLRWGWFAAEFIGLAIAFQVVVQLVIAGNANEEGG